MYKQLCFFLLFLASASAYASSVVSNSSSVTGYGTLHGELSKLTDGVHPTEATVWNDTNWNVWWTQGENPQTASIRIDLGQVYEITGFTMSVDNNDEYIIMTSEDGAGWTSLMPLFPQFGEVTFGMDTISSIAGDPEFTPSWTPSPGKARYVGLLGVAGDGLYSVGEISIYGNRLNPTSATVPEPTTIALIGLSFAGMGYMRRRKAQA